jgi:hypothetical protein
LPDFVADVRGENFHLFEMRLSLLLDFFSLAFIEFLHFVLQFESLSNVLILALQVEHELRGVQRLYELQELS